MSNANRDNLEERVRRLEEKVEKLEQQKTKSSASSSTQEDVAADDGQSDTERTDSPGWQAKNMQFGEEWLNRIGIGLLLIGVAFLFKYSIDQGWLVPPVRSAIGLGIGLSLFIGGWQMKAQISPLKQILLGGGIAAYLHYRVPATFQLLTVLFHLKSFGHLW
ncbi:MAG: DUF2339 domain-containing protein [Fodinibius sp.]|nr:DUF2339 domain-containing protein [Fodinibius sp.]